jgi:hypothetical protein
MSLVMVLLLLRIGQGRKATAAAGLLLWHHVSMVHPFDRTPLPHSQI